MAAQVSFSNTYRIAAVPVLSEIPIIGDIFFQQVYLSYYIAIAVAIAGAVIIKKTRFGLRLRACGEFPQAADSVGVNVYRTRYAGVLICGFLAGMSGLMLVVPTATEFNARRSGLRFPGRFRVDFWPVETRTNRFRSVFLWDHEDSFGGLLSDPVAGLSGD